MNTSTVADAASLIASELRSLKCVNAPALHAVRKRHSSVVRGWRGTDVVALANVVLDSNEPGRNVIAHGLILHHERSIDSLRLKDVERLGRFIGSWSDVDVFACYVSGPAWRAGRISDSAVHRWARSENRWWRRTALVSTIPLNVKNQGGEGDAARTLAVCEFLVDDRDDMVVKALSWALRAAAACDPKSVEGFLDEQECRLTPRVLREVRNKIRTGLKNPRW